MGRARGGAMSAGARRSWARDARHGRRHAPRPGGAGSRAWAYGCVAWRCGRAGVRGFEGGFGRRGNAGQGAGFERFEQGGELLGQAAQVAHEAEQRRQLQQAPQTPGAQKSQHHLDDRRDEAGDGFAQVLFAGFFHAAYGITQLT